jgi:hypothetical protein
VTGTGPGPETPLVEPTGCPPDDVVAWVMQMLLRRGNQIRSNPQSRHLAASAASALLSALGVSPDAAS